MPIMDQLATRHRYVEWKGRNTLATDLFIANYYLSAWQTPGWNLLQHTTAADSHGVTRSGGYLSDGQRRGTRGLTVDATECDSRLAAHEELMLRLADFQSPLVRRDEDEFAIGDISFSTPARQVVIFARANVVLIVSRAEAEEVPVQAVAKELDRVLLSGAGMPPKRLPGVRRLQLCAAAEKGAPARIDFEAVDLYDRPIWFRFSVAGRIWREGGVMWVLARDDQQPLDVTAIGADGETFETRLAAVAGS